MTHGTMQDDRGGWRRTVWYDSAGRHESLSVPRQRRPPVIEWIMVVVLGVTVIGGAFGTLVELVR